jgi:hypothetical protein
MFLVYENEPMERNLMQVKPGHQYRPQLNGNLISISERL